MSARVPPLAAGYNPGPMELFPSAVAIGLATLFALAGPQQQGEPTIAAEIEALIEKTNALSSFHLRFQGSNGKEGDEREEATMEVVYRGPWSARVTLEQADGVTGTYFDDRRITFTAATDESEVWHSVELSDSEIRTTLDELFPTGEPLGPGAVFDLVHGSSFSLFFELSGRSAMFAWLPRMLLDLKHVTRDAGELVWSTGELELRIARTTGLPQALLVTEEGLGFELAQRDRAWRRDVPSPGRSAPRTALCSARAGAARTSAVRSRAEPGETSSGVWPPRASCGRCSLTHVA